MDLHGMYGYRLGCRCSVCTAANTKKVKDYRARRKLNAPSPRALAKQRLLEEIAKQRAVMEISQIS